MPQREAFQVITYTTFIEFHETLLDKRQLKVLLFTKEEMVLPVFRNLQHKHLLELHFVTFGWELFDKARLVKLLQGVCRSGETKSLALFKKS